MSSILGIQQNSHSDGINNTSIQGSESSNLTSTDVALSYELDSAELSHTLILKDRLEGGAHLLSMISVDNDSLETTGNFLTQIQTKLSEANSLDPLSSDYSDKIAEITTIENQMSAFIGSLFHKSELDVELRSGDSDSTQSFLDFINIYENPNDEGSLVGQIASIEVNMLQFVEAAHNPQTCPTCILANQSSVSDTEGEIPLADGPSPTTSVTGSLSNTTNSGDNATIIV